MILQIPPGAKTFEIQNRMMWFGDNGIVYARPKEVYTPQTKEDILNEMAVLHRIFKDQKVCIIGEADVRAKPPSKEVRALMATELAKVFKAMAILTNSPLSRMVANLFFRFNPPEFPMKMFSNEKEAREWIEKYL